MSSNDTPRGFSTRALHTQIPYLHPLPHVMPPYRTSTFVSESLDTPVDPEFPFKYGRIGHPNAVLLEHTLASLEEGEAAVVTADGMRAISVACMSLLSAYREGSIIATGPLYSDTYALFTDMTRIGRKSFFLDADQSPSDQLRAYIARSHAKTFAEEIPPIDFVFIESPANPTLTIYDIKELCLVAHAHQIPVIVDSTFASPYNQRPLGLGADLVIHSLTKYCCGNGSALGGAVIGPTALINPIRKRLRYEGGHLDPDSTWLIQSGLQTFGIRMREHNHHGMNIARFLSSARHRSTIPAVHYPGLPSHPGHEIAKAQMRTPQGKVGFGGMVSFELCHEQCVGIFAETLTKKTCIELAVSLGSTSSTFAVPARQIHSGLSAAERAALGIRNTLIRFSVGIEDIQDIRHALTLAIKSVQQAHR